MARSLRAREVPRLRSVNGFFQNAIGRTAHVSKQSVQDALLFVPQQGQRWARGPLAGELRPAGR